MMKKILIIISFLQTQLNGFSQNELIDDRDGLRYETIQIGDQIWMSQNLSFMGANRNITSDYEYLCSYNTNMDNVKYYGGLYSWRIAQKVCPLGWHLPSKSEFELMLSNLSQKDEQDIYSQLIKIKFLTDDSFGGWHYLMTSSYHSGEFGRFLDLNSRALFWTSTEFSKNDAYNLTFKKKKRKCQFIGNRVSTNKVNALSVRCVKDPKNR